MIYKWVSLAPEGGGGGGGNGAILGISKAPVRQDAGLPARKLLDVNVREVVMWPAWGENNPGVTLHGFIRCLFSPSLFSVAWKQPKLTTKSFSSKSTSRA